MSIVQHMPDMEPQAGQCASLRSEFAVPGLFRNLVRQCLAVLGLCLIVIAVPIGIVTPILPIGLPLAILGVVLLGRNAVWGRRWMEGVLARNPRRERFAPAWLMRAVFRREKTHR